jgi:hypothetical protein
MDKEQTQELWSKGAEAWNIWALALLKQKKELEESGNWAADWFGEGQNPETRAWLTEAQADFSEALFPADAAFQNFVFPGPANFDRAHFAGKALFTQVRFAYLARFPSVSFDSEASFKQAQFFNLAVFDDAVFAALADFEKAAFLRESNGPLAPAARFQKTQFLGRTEFRGSRFSGHCEFIRTRFGGNLRFDEAEFAGDANFEGASFEGTAGLVKAQFQGPAKFDQARFGGDARFGEVQFRGLAHFEETEFGGKASFRTAKFAGEATFDRAGFASEARFSEAAFAEPVHFRRTRFQGIGEFQKATFAKPVDFTGCSFKGDADFGGASFSQAADFSETKFKASAGFSECTFHNAATFHQAIFKGRASFRRAVFAGKAGFEALQSRAAFVLAGSRFAQAPSFQEASFRQTPSLDYIAIADPMCGLPARNVRSEPDPRPFFLRGMRLCADSDVSARYRRLRQFAAEAQDYEREQEFFARELRCRRFWLDRPFGEGLGRFWFGWLYGALSDFGRSFGRPLLVWALSIPLFALVYLVLRDGSPAGASSAADRAPAFPVWPERMNAPALLDWSVDMLRWMWVSASSLFSGGGCITGDSGATPEAFFLALKNSFFFIGWESQDAARRVYGCLYGMEHGSVLPAANVPLSVSAVAILQNAVSAVLIFLVLLAFRNLLKAR